MGIAGIRLPGDSRRRELVRSAAGRGYGDLKPASKLMPNQARNIRDRRIDTHFATVATAWRVIEEFPRRPKATSGAIKSNKTMRNPTAPLFGSVFHSP